MYGIYTIVISNVHDVVYLINFWSNLINILNIDLMFIILQILLLYIITHIFYEQNILRLVLNLLIFLLILASFLMLYQFELFACFLIVSELLLFSFIYAYLYNLNVGLKLLNLELMQHNVYSNLILIGVIASFLIYTTSNLILQNLNDTYVIFNKLISIYTNITFSDLIFLFNFFFIYNSILYFLLILILFIMTFIIIYTTFLVYNLNINIHDLNLIEYLQEYDTANFNATLLLKKKKKIKKLRLFKFN